LVASGVFDIHDPAWFGRVRGLRPACPGPGRFAGWVRGAGVIVLAGAWNG
jgi:hypothetical protein